MSRAYSSCASARTNQLNERTPYIIYHCDENGDYSPLQETVGSPKWKWCFDKDGGNLLGPSRNIQSCNCVIKNHQLEKSGAAHTFGCDSQGYFAVHQSNDTHGWCVHRETGETTVSPLPSTTPINCN